MIDRLIEISLRNRFLVVTLWIGIAAWGLWAMLHAPIDAIPDLSDNQVIVFTDWSGRSPQEVEDQITYPLTVNLQGLPGVKVVRSSSAFGFSMIFVIFEDDVDLYFARTRVLERLNLVTKQMPVGVVPTLGPDATGVGHVFWYTVEGGGLGLRGLARRLRGATLFAHGITTHFDSMGVVNQPIQNAVGSSGVADLFVPAPVERAHPLVSRK
jgi:copper/silver efflux system protein